MKYEVMGFVVVALGIVSGGVASLYKVTSNMRKEREEENKDTLKQAKSYVDSRVYSLEQEMKFQKHLYENKTIELAQKIEQLRDEVRRHHGQLVDLLTKMINKG